MTTTTTTSTYKYDNDNDINYDAAAVNAISTAQMRNAMLIAEEIEENAMSIATEIGLVAGISSLPSIAINPLVASTCPDAIVDAAAAVSCLGSSLVLASPQHCLDTGNLTGVIVQVDKSSSQARVAVKSGLLKTWYVYHRLGRITGCGNNVELNGLSETLKNWKMLKEITEREAARNESMVGGQGKGDVTCNCKGPCNTNQCSCKKAG